MKNKVLLVAICAALCATLASCSQLQTGNTATVSINSRQLLDRARAILPGSASDDEVILKIAVVVNGEVRTKQFVFINDDNSSDKVYSFGNIPPSATVEVYCLYYSTVGVDKRPTCDMIGASGPIVVEAGTNDIKVKMLTRSEYMAGATYLTASKVKKLYQLLDPTHTP